MIRNIIKSSITFALLSSLTIFSACGEIDNDGDNIVGDNFVSAEVIDDINASVMLSVVQNAIDSTAQNAFGYKAVKIVYETVNQDGEEIEASGLLVIPTATPAYQAYLASVGKMFSISMIAENHGTIFTDAEAPTNVEVKNGMPDYPIAVLMTGYAGFASVIPDYIGYGVSNDTAHPYMLKKASARASLDMIRASVRYMTDANIVFNSQLYISGYSEGGHTAMALAEEIETNHNDEFTLMGVAPMAGPHDLEALGNIEIDASHTMIYPAFLGYLADSYSFYNEDIALSDIVLAEDTQTFHALFGGSYMSAEIHGALGLTENYGFATYTADNLFKPTFIDDYKNSLNTGLALKEKLKENSTYNWIPQTKMNLIHCMDDEIIPYTMSQKAYDSFVDKGSEDVTISLIPSTMIPEASTADPLVHSRCGTTAYGAAVTWFNAIRQGDL